MKKDKQKVDFGQEQMIKMAARMTTSQRLRWLETARNFALKSIPKSSLRIYLKLRNSIS